MYDQAPQVVVNSTSLASCSMVQFQHKYYVTSILFSTSRHTLHLFLQDHLFLFTSIWVAVIFILNLSCIYLHILKLCVCVCVCAFANIHCSVYSCSKTMSHFRKERRCATVVVCTARTVTENFRRFLSSVTMKPTTRR